MGNSISKHIVFQVPDRWNEDLITTREADWCSGCSFPEELNLSIFHEDTVDDYELFVRFSRISDNYPFAEGFLPFMTSGSEVLEIPLHTINLSKWPKLVEITRGVEDEGEGFDGDSLLQTCMRELTTTVVAINKTSSEASLVCTQCNFSDDPARSRELPRLYGIDFMGDHAYCWPKGRLPSRPHDLDRSEGRAVSLGMQFELVNSECQWALNCECHRHRGDFIR
jgi:hypothetical protein